MTNNNAEKETVILDAAAKHFAAQGFDGARVDEIAIDAGVNKATLYYRIGDKEALYDKVYTRLLNILLFELHNSCLHVKNIEDKLIAFVKCVAKVGTNNSYMAPMVLREVASGGEHLSSDAIEKMQQIRLTLADILKQGEKQGRFRQVNPFLIHMLIIGTLNMYAAARPIRETISKHSINRNEDIYTLPLDKVAEEVSQLILNSIRC